MNSKQIILDEIKRRYETIFERYEHVNGNVKIELANRLDILQDLYHWIRKNVHE